MAESYWEFYRALVKRLMPVLKKGDGYSEEEIARAEARIGCRLPNLLREFYLLAGKREDINAVFERLLTPDEMERHGDVLAFYDENQSVCFWGVDIHDPRVEDPKVLRADNVSALIWEEDLPRLSEFLTAMLFLQAVNGGMRYCGVGAASSDKIAQAEGAWEAFHIGGVWKDRVLVRDGQALFISGDGVHPEVYAGARSLRKFLDLTRQFGAEWGYCTLDDE
ncbi:hypothetical protein CCAX7_18310 [Capsulimonas corticalis]|uniref:Uncharacterized protein n=1 Tax=Capsulimonas corticalis TaxID=2219043 RepID=A0A402D5H7_9BACT|nr:SMI1/KNR4 family protein [Capsulimonas corticalis]BDI29780.1 hypothetical protein CCAX7_18310 [Capsulimonas corticalis]